MEMMETYCARQYNCLNEIQNSLHFQVDLFAFGSIIIFILSGVHLSDHNSTLDSADQATIKFKDIDNKY